jgi:C4-dicarboxylate-specific signal transduction histidine kinase
MTLSRKGAKGRKRGTGTKAKTRTGRSRRPRADLGQQLKANRREIAQLRRQLVEVLEAQAATSEVLRIISNSSNEIQPVLDAVAENAARLCDASNAAIFRLENDLLQWVASYGEFAATSQARQKIPANRDTVIGRAVCDRRTVHVHNLAAEDKEYPAGSQHAKREGHRTTLATPLLREGTAIGVVLIRRIEVRPFHDKQIALLEAFADQAVIAIENVRLFEAEKQRTIALAHANRVATVGYLTAWIAHEVTQPIAAVINDANAALHWLDTQPPNLGEVRESLDSIVKVGDRASAVVNRIRGLVKKAPPRRDSLNINQVIFDATTLTRSELLSHDIALQVRPAQKPPLVQADRIQLQQVLLNLIVNAIEAMSTEDEGPRELRISASHAVDEVLVAVGDSGPGMTAESFDRLFKAFHTTKPAGMGMGLSICRSIVEAHGGRIWATANAPRGAIFQFTLPAL